MEWIKKIKFRPYRIKLNIHDNTFNDYGKSSINALRMNYINVSYKPGTQKEDDYDDFDDENRDD